MKGFLITLLVVLVIAGGFFGMYVNIVNSEVKTRNKITKQQQVCEIYYTKLWEIIKTKGGVANEYAEKFEEIQVGIMEGRYSTGGQMMKWIQEANPEFDSSLYKDLMNSIEGERNGFFVEQQKLLDMVKQHDDMLTTIPSKWFLKDKEHIKVIVLKNQATKDAYETGTDSSPELFT